MADRNGSKYTGSITPDHVIKDDPATEKDEVIEAAKKWLAQLK